MVLTVLIARLGVAKIDWIGTSLGGLVGMVLAGQKGSPIHRLVVNDIGPYLPWQALHRLANAVRSAPQTFRDLDSAIAYHRTTLAPFGDLTDAQWYHLTQYSVMEAKDGTWQKTADPQIVAAFKPGWFFNLSLWSYWDTIRCPALVLHGVQSDLLSEATAREMTQRGPKADLVQFPDCGHAPALMAPVQTRAIITWLEGHPAVV
jgi:pimeloyl-ACP methyl ester carboxylesterase